MTEKIKRVMTPELQKKFMGMVPVSMEKGMPFTPEIFKDERPEFKTVYYQRPWTNSEKANFSGLAEDQEKADDLVRITVINIENGWDLATGDDVPFEPESEKDKAVSKKIFANWPNKLIEELLKNAMKISGLSSEEKEVLE